MDADRYFVASTDTFQGSSGGAAYDSNAGVIGVLVDGEQDFAKTAEGCRTVKQNTAPDAVPKERFVYAHRAIAGLCSALDSAICELACEQPCKLTQRPIESAGCSALAGPHDRPGWLWISSLLLMACLRWRNRSRPRSARTAPAVLARRSHRCYPHCAPEPRRRQERRWKR
jgi:hypothetical protein